MFEDDEDLYDLQDEEEGRVPYTSISDRMDVPDFSQAAQQRHEQFTSGGQQNQRDIVKSSISQKLAPGMMNEPQNVKGNPEASQIPTQLPQESQGASDLDDRDMMRMMIQSRLISGLQDSGQQAAAGVNPYQPHYSKGADPAIAQMIMLRRNQQNKDQRLNAAKDRIAVAALEKQKDRDLRTSEGKLNRETTIEAAGIRNDRLINQRDQKRFDDVGKILTVERANPNTVIGRAAANKQSIDNAMGILDGVTNFDDLSPQQAFEMTKVLDRVLSQGRPSVSGVEHLDIKTAPKAWANIKQYWTNKVQGAKAGDFIKNIVHNFEKEKRKANEQISEGLGTSIITYEDLADKYPERWARLLRKVKLGPSTANLEITQKFNQPETNSNNSYPPGSVRKGPNGEEFHKGENGKWRQVK